MLTFTVPAAINSNPVMFSAWVRRSSQNLAVAFEAVNSDGVSYVDSRSESTREKMDAFVAKLESNGRAWRYLTAKDFA